MMPDQIQELTVRTLEAAADRIEAKGWQRHREGPEEGPNCTFGAIRWAAWDVMPEDLPQGPLHGDWFRGAVDATSQQLRRLGHDSDIPWWNDFVARDHYEVAEMLRLAAKEVANSHG